MTAQSLEQSSFCDLNFSQFNEDETSFPTLSHTSNRIFSPNKLIDVTKKILHIDFDLKIFDKFYDISLKLSNIVVVFIKIFSEFNYFLSMQLVVTTGNEVLYGKIAEEIMI